MGLGIIWTLVVIKALGTEAIVPGHCVQGEEKLEEKVQGSHTANDTVREWSLSQFEI